MPLSAAQSRTLFVDNLVESKRILDEAKNDGFNGWMGIDPSLACTSIVAGFIDKEREDLPVTHVSCSPKMSADLKRYHRLVKVGGYFLGRLKKHKPLIFAIEGYSFDSPYNRETMAEVGGTLRMVAWRHPELFGASIVVAPRQLKKYICGPQKKGTTVSKAKIMMAVYKNYGYEPRNDNEADAMVLSAIARDLTVVCEQFGDKVNDIAAAGDKELRKFMNDGWMDMDHKLYRYQWEVLVKLLTSKCGQTMLEYKDK